MWLGIVINRAAVLVGGGIVPLVGDTLPEAMRLTAMQAIGIIMLLVGVANFLILDIANLERSGDLASA